MQDLRLPRTGWDSPRTLAAGPDGQMWFTRGPDHVGRISTPLPPARARTPLGAPPLAIPGLGAASPYPSQLELSGLSGTVTEVRLDLYGFFHKWPAEVDALLVGPGGRKAMVLSDAGSRRSVFGTVLTIDDAARRWPRSPAPSPTAPGACM